MSNRVLFSAVAPASYVSAFGSSGASAIARGGVLSCAAASPAQSSSTGTKSTAFVSLRVGLPNMNGIVATENGNWLIVNNTVAGQLYRVDPSTGASVQIQLLNAPFNTQYTNGLLLHGTTLYSVENFLGRIAVITLSKDLLTGTIDSYITSPNFDVPSTAAFFGRSIYAINARFRMDGSSPPEADDDIVKVAR